MPHATHLLVDGVEDVEGAVEVDALGSRKLLVVVGLVFVKHV